MQKLIRMGDKRKMTAELKGIHAKTFQDLDVIKDVLKLDEEKIADLEKENAGLKNQVSFLEDNLRVARKDREDLQLDVGKGLQEFIKDCPYTALKLYANEKYVEENAELKEQNIKDCENFNKTMKETKEQWNNEHYQLTKAKELLAKWVELFKPKGGNIPPTPIQVDTEQFLSEVEE